MLGAMSDDEKSGSQRAIKPPWLPPGPLADLKALLYQLYVEAGTPRLNQMEKWAAMAGQAGMPGRDSVARIIGSATMPPSQADLVTVVFVLARAARWDPDDAARRARDLWVAARMDSARTLAGGMPVSQVDPLLLEVHRAIESESAGERIDPLPMYVPRPHDERLRAIVDDAATGESRLVVVVGGPAVGKTRACWESARRLDDGWRLWHPLSPGRVEALLDGLSRVGPRTVVWLNEAQHYLMPAPLGEEAAARLRELLADCGCR